MNVNADLYQLLKGAHSGASPNYGARIYPDMVPQHATYPCAVYEQDSIDPDADWGGANGLSVHTMTVTVYADTREEASAGADYIEEHLHGFQGSTFNNGVADVQLNQILMIDVSHGAGYYDPDTQKYASEAFLDITTKS